MKIEDITQSLLTNLSEGIWVVDETLNTTFVNPSVCAMIGYNNEELLGKSLLNFIDSSYHALIEEKKIRRRQGIKEQYEVSLKHRSGKDVYVSAEVVPFFDEQKNFLGSIACLTDITVKKEMESQYEESQRRFRETLDNVDLIVVQLDNDAAIVYINESFLKITGYVKEEVIYKNWINYFIPAAEREKVKEVFFSALETKVIAKHYENSILTKEGKKINIFWNNTLLFDSNKNVIGTSSIGTDITAQKEIQEKLFWLASFPQLNTSPVIEIDLDGKIFYTNAAAEQLFPGIREKGFEHDFFPDFKELISLICNSSLKGVHREVKVDVRWFAQSLIYIEKYQRIRVYALDITQTKESEMQVKDINQKLNDIIEFLPDPIFVVDKDKKVIAWNKALEEMTSVEKKSILGKGHYEYSTAFYGHDRPLLIDLLDYPGINVEKFYDFVKRYNNTLVAEVFINHLYGGKGAFVWIKASPLLDKEGNVVGGIEIIIDITEKKELEIIAKEDRDAFAKLVKEKSLVLLTTQKELVAAQHLSEIGALAATVAHELRNPLAAISAATYNLKRKISSSDLSPHLINIEKKVAESDQIINNLLNYSRIKNPHFSYFSICELVKDCVDSVKQRYRGWEVDLIQECDCTIVISICADALQIRELLNNILNNAYESLVDKRGKVIFKAKCDPVDGLFVTIEDNGIGMSEDELSKISKPFFTTKSKGTGLGLNICTRIITMHNGQFDVKSTKGKGTVISIKLPVNQGWKNE